MSEVDLTFASIAALIGVAATLISLRWFGSLVSVGIGVLVGLGAFQLLA